MLAPALIGPIYTVRFLSHATSARQAYDMSYDCRSILKHVLKCMRDIHTFALIGTERDVHTFRTSPVSSSAQAFRTRHKHFPLFVC